jgi:Asp-tRNA(Asn)/Glu-tRNA(Gln) amidotransferase A subunit family amidase
VNSSTAPSLRAHLDDLAASFSSAGTAVVEIVLPAGLDDLIAAGRVTLAVDAAAFHRATFAMHEAEYGPGIGDLIRDGLSTSDVEADEAIRVRAAYGAAVVPVLASVDVLLSPVAPGPAPLRVAGTGDNALCAAWSFLGVPAISLPTGLDAAGMPLAVQLIAGTDRLGRLLGVASWVERLVAFGARPAA